MDTSTDGEGLSYRLELDGGAVEPGSEKVLFDKIVFDGCHGHVVAYSTKLYTRGHTHYHAGSVCVRTTIDGRVATCD
jgi:hypothetical protein